LNNQIVTMRFLRITTLFALFAMNITLAFADVAEGEKLFNANCTSCHAIDEKVVGPALKGIDKKHSEAWLIKWIKNSQSMIKAGDAAALKIYNEYNQSVMTSFEHLSDDQVKSILEYIKNPPAPVVPEGTGVASQGAAQTGGFYSSTTMWALAVMAVVLLIIVFVLQRIRKTVEGMYYEKFPEAAALEAEHAVDPKTTWKYKLFTKHPVVGTIVVLVGVSVIFGIYGFNYGVKEVGVQQDYAPTQPINYSHELHAGKYKINCLYCHTGADQGKQATIPSASTCMNCHMHVTASKNYDGQVSPEIAKIYDAVGWDAEKKAYIANYEQKPIKWVRIHNLPDLAYFNHAQHVKVGNVECQACHGPVETMKVVYQQSSLQMGWCINCHREAKVDVENNDYYEQLHSKLKAEGKSYATVANIGGLECGKCHY
jgi:mono/diheme cytochrome c family protein